MPTIRTEPALNDSHFVACNEKLTRERATHHVDAPLDQLYPAMQAALVALGLSVEKQDFPAGLIEAAAAAPAPLDAQEWNQARDSDLPQMRELIANETSWPGWMFQFKVEGTVFVVKVKMVQAQGGTTVVRLNARSRDSFAPTREQYLPCATAAMILKKVWTQFERQRLAP